MDDNVTKRYTTKASEASHSGPCRDLWRGRCSKYKRGTWNTAFNRAVLLADVYRNGCFCIDTAANAMTQVLFFVHLLINLE